MTTTPPTAALDRAEAAAALKPSQADKILGFLEAHRGRWVSMPALWEASGAFAVHSRVSDLRRRGLVVDHKNEWVDGACHSFYRLPEIQNQQTT